MIVRIKKREGCEDLDLPKYMTEGSSGLDLMADVSHEYIIQAGDRALISAGFYMSMQPGFEAQIRPRSGLAAKHGITVLNAPGTIDADYRGLVQVILINHGHYDYVIKRGDRIAQMVITPITKAIIEEVGALDETARGEGGMGHTGT